MAQSLGVIDIKAQNFDSVKRRGYNYIKSSRGSEPSTTAAVI
ncbi:hypothetical protein Y11_07211 [Yersinia enterocolitica subsp. palearctica Y11]|uniref:Uncharacterized protein n=2 Tax=Yersinia enterocolitica TaxID=630 RepID=A0A0H3NQH0_YERE1|nr:unknown protein [Yersinia enterocolitica W22703]CBY27460.1 hypothetical protein Y11_07211 [Yersinia enterocolitica subsp. palearctica Y11]CCO68875.1 hypothetical protein D322_2001 [Yersinia enterocolitica IP 10393]